jgi:hypothetical protein
MNAIDRRSFLKTTGATLAASALSGVPRPVLAAMAVTDVRAELQKRLQDYAHKTLPDWTYEFNIDEVKFKFLSIDYDKLDEIKTTPKTIRRHRIDNPTDAEITSRFTESTEYADEFTWSITEGLKLGAEATFKVEAPLIGGAETKVSAELSLESTQGKTTRKTNTWAEEIEVKVPAKTSIEATSLLELAEINSPFTITLIATGFVGVKRRRGDTGYEGGGLLERGFGGPGPPPQPFLPNEDSRKFQAKGILQGVNGLYITVTTKPLGKL